MAISIGMLGYRFMGRAHTNALTRLPIFFPDAPEVELEMLGGRTKESVEEAGRRFGFDRRTTDWEEIVEDDEIDVFVNLTPNYMHEKPSVRALEEGKHVLCEKPLADDLESAENMMKAAENSPGRTACAFNYRFVPAIQLARTLIDEGRLGDIRHFRGLYLQDWLVDPEAPWSWRNDEEMAGSGALGDLGAHTVDLARFLVGEIDSVVGNLETFVGERPLPGGEDTREVDVDDAYSMMANFENGAMGVFEASRFASGSKNDHRIEIHGSKGSIRFSLERLNELGFYEREEDPKGYRNIMVTEEGHPFIEAWWPPGHVIGWEHTFVHEWYRFLRAISRDEEFHPNFGDGFAVQRILDAVGESSERGEWVDL